MSRWLVDGRPGALVSPDDRGLLYGDGLFETVAFHGGESRLWALHMQRLARGCERLGLPAPDAGLLFAECRELVGDRARAIVRVSLTRGVGGRAYTPPADPRPTRIVMLREWPVDMARRRDGLSMATSPVRLAPGPAAGLKHMNRLEQVLIARGIAAAGADEAMVLDPRGRIVEALTGNIVVVRDGRLIAPGPHPAAVAGVGLAWLRCRAGAGLVERDLRADELEAGDGLWVINSIQGPCPVRSLDGRSLGIDGVVRSWQNAWREEVEE